MSEICENCRFWTKIENTSWTGSCDGNCGVVRSLNRYTCPEWETKPKPKPVKRCLTCRYYKLGKIAEHKYQHLCLHPDTEYNILHHLGPCGKWEPIEAKPDTKPEDDTRLPVKGDYIQLRDLMDAIEKGIQQENWKVGYEANDNKIIIEWGGEQLPRRVFRLGSKEE